MYTDGCISETTKIPPQEPGGLNTTLLWPESDIGQIVLIDCPCGNISLSGDTQSNATRYCGGNFTAGAVWEKPQDERCNFTETARRLCQVIEVCMT